MKNISRQKKLAHMFHHTLSELYFNEKSYNDLIKKLNDYSPPERLSAENGVLRQGHKVQEDRGQRPQAALRPHARETPERQKLHALPHQAPQLNGGVGLGHADQLPQYEEGSTRGA